MTRLINIFLLAALFTLIPVASYAESAPDSLVTSPSIAENGQDSLIADRKDSLSRQISEVNASLYKMQKRYRPKDKTVYTQGGFFNDSYISLSLGSLFPLNSSYTSGATASLAFGKRFNPFHGIRLNLNAGFNNSTYRYERIFNYNAYLSYLFNATAYLHGYDESRVCNLFIVAGLGMDGISSSDLGKSAVSPGAMLGINLNIHLMRDLDFFFEPFVKIARDNATSAHTDNWHEYIWSVIPSAGISYRIQNPAPEEILPGKDWYCYTGLAVLTQLSEMTNVMEMKDRLGVEASAGIGRRCSDNLSIRGYLDFSRYNWRYRSGTTTLPCTQFAIGTDASLDIIGLFTDKKETFFGAGPIIGLTAGYMNKQYHFDSARINPLYFGGRVGIGVTFRISEQFAILLEGMDRIISYSASTSDKNSSAFYSNYIDNLISVNLGVEYHFSK